jgi:hypothetical protein
MSKMDGWMNVKMNSKDSKVVGEERLFPRRQLHRRYPAPSSSTAPLAPYSAGFGHVNLTRVRVASLHTWHPRRSRLSARGDAPVLYTKHDVSLIAHTGKY